MAKWNNKGNQSITFGIESNEQTVDFFRRMQQESKASEEAFKERIQQLFDEEIELGGPKKDEAYNQVLKVFAIGYQHGWNDFHGLMKGKEPEQ